MISTKIRIFSGIANMWFMIFVITRLKISNAMHVSPSQADKLRVLGNGPLGNLALIAQYYLACQCLPCMALYCVGVMCSNPGGATSQYLYGFLLLLRLSLSWERLKRIKKEKNTLKFTSKTRKTKQKRKVNNNYTII